MKSAIEKAALLIAEEKYEEAVKLLGEVKKEQNEIQKRLEIELNLMRAYYELEEIDKVKECVAFILDNTSQSDNSQARITAVKMKEWLEDAPVDWSGEYDTVKQIGIKDYRQKYYDECKDLWKNCVPKSGQADNLQGELLRQVEKLRGEACGNGNRNWDDNFEWFCDFLTETLLASKLFSEDEQRKIHAALEYIKENGNYARDYIEGRIKEYEVDVLKLAYVNDDLYDYLADAVAVFYISNKNPIVYEAKDFIYR